MSSTNVNVSKNDKIEQARQNLPLPEQPPTASDWNSADARTVNVGSGHDVASSDVSTGAGSDAGLREPASTKDADLSGVGRQGKEGLEAPPKDAAAKYVVVICGFAAWAWTGRVYGGI
ncbi:hypothetical protein F5X96DRAFT_669909 [Biscogniauxia mediterranea]|nr:hypothetical protein F5X96DRAFT_669909 [Biscogniauxia mediterranea]